MCYTRHNCRVQSPPSLLHSILTRMRYTGGATVILAVQDDGYLFKVTTSLDAVFRWTTTPGARSSRQCCPTDFTLRAQQNRAIGIYAFITLIANQVKTLRRANYYPRYRQLIQYLPLPLSHKHTAYFPSRPFTKLHLTQPKERPSH